MELTNLPGPINLSGNFPLITGTAAEGESMTVDLVINSVFILREKYYPDELGNLVIDYRDIITPVLEVLLPDAGLDIFHQEKAYGVLGIFYGPGIGPPEAHYSTVVKGGTDQEVTDVAEFLQKNFLTWQLQVKRVKQTDQEWLTYYAAIPAKVKVRGYFASGPAITADLIDLPDDQLSTFNVKNSLINSLFPEPPTNPVAYDVWVENMAGTRLSNMQRYLITKEFFEFDDVFLFENTIGGIDTIRFTGQKIQINEFSIQRALFYKTMRDYSIRNLTLFRKNTGSFRSMEERQWSVEFFKSLTKYLQTGSGFSRIYAQEIKLESILNELNDGEFEYAVSLDQQYYSVERETADLPTPHIFPPEPPPAEGIFTNEFTDEFQ